VETIQRVVRYAAALGLLAAWGVSQRLEVRAAYWRWHGRQTPDAVTRLEQRFKPVAAELPRLSLVGYLSDEDTFSTEGMRRYYLTQYCLAPMVVSRSLAVELLIGNFKTPERARELAHAHGLAIQKDFGGGLLILRRVAP